MGLPAREATKIGDLWARDEIGLELSVEVRAPVVVGIYPMRIARFVTDGGFSHLNGNGQQNGNGFANGVHRVAGEAVDTEGSSGRRDRPVAAWGPRGGRWSSSRDSRVPEVVGMKVVLVGNDLMIGSRIAAAADSATAPFIRVDEPRHMPPLRR